MFMQNTLLSAVKENAKENFLASLLGNHLVLSVAPPSRRQTGSHPKPV